jgi:hypothetical protein
MRLLIEYNFLKHLDSTIQWLLEGDPAIRWQTLRDLVNSNQSEVERERERVSKQGWGARLLALQDHSGIWANGIYSPKWTSTTYTMLLLKRFGLPPKNHQALKACNILLDRGFYHDGGINYFRSFKQSETCVTGMILSILAYFQYEDDRIHALVEHLLTQQMSDGGWNCQSYKGATHSSFHTTILVLEGLRECEKFHPKSITAIQLAQQKAREFLLVHQLYKSHRSGEVANPAFTRFSFPPRWHYDILRALDYFQECQAEYDDRLRAAIELLIKKRKPDGRWVLQSRHHGKTFFEMEQVSEPSRWNTLRALRILKWWKLRDSVIG